jgi:predicted Zn finger-like uncharacterized protein
MMHIECPHCETGLRLADKYAGRKARCPRCKEVLQLPDESEREYFDDPEPADEEEEEQEEEERPRRKKKKRRPRRSTGPSPRNLIFGILFLGFGLFLAVGSTIFLIIDRKVSILVVGVIKGILFIVLGLNYFRRE